MEASQNSEETDETEVYFWHVREGEKDVVHVPQMFAQDRDTAKEYWKHQKKSSLPIFNFLWGIAYHPNHFCCSKRHSVQMDSQIQ